MGAIKPIGVAGAVWGVLGVTALLSMAVYRLSPIAWASFFGPLDAVHYASYVGSLFFLGYTEGYKAFQKQFSPRVIARARYLAQHPTLIRILLAPMFCMGFFHATRKRLVISWGLTFGIVGLVAIVSRLAQPWRGIVDFGVVVALAWGLIAMAVYGVRALAGHAMPVPDDTPSPSEAA